MIQNAIPAAGYEYVLFSTRTSNPGMTRPNLQRDRNLVGTGWMSDSGQYERRQSTNRRC